MENLIPEKDYKHIQEFLFRHSGIALGPNKQAMVSSRLAKRLRHYNLEKYADYLKKFMTADNLQERQILIDLLTTNETYFFREMGHFDYLKKKFLPSLKPNQTIKVWSAASSTGEEAYSIAMILADGMGINNQWDIFGSDICTQVIESARSAHYSTNRIQGIPEKYLKNYCLKGTGSYQETLLIDPQLQKKVSFSQVNLNTTLPNLGKFDLIFLRNILIYFNPETKQQIVNRVVSTLNPGGLFFIGHSETLKGLCNSVEQVEPTIYRKL